MKKALCVFTVIGFLLVGSLPVAAEPYKLGNISSSVVSSYCKVAEVKGLWEKQGVTVKLIEYANPSDITHAGIQRRVDLLPSPLPALISYRNAGAFDAVYLGTFCIADHHKYVILKNDLVKKSLKGQTIGTFSSNDLGNNFLLSSYLKTVNTSLTDVRLVEVNPNDLEANFIKGRLQVVLTLDRGNKFYEQAKGVIAFSTRDFYEPHGMALVKKGGLAAIPPDDLKKILRGCVDAILWIRDPANWEEYKAILKEYVFTGMSDLPGHPRCALSLDSERRGTVWPSFDRPDGVYERGLSCVV